MGSCLDVTCLDCHTPAICCGVSGDRPKVSLFYSQPVTADMAELALHCPGSLCWMLCTRHLAVGVVILLRGYQRHQHWNLLLSVPLRTN